MQISVTKRDGSTEPFNADHVNEAIAMACVGLENPFEKTSQLAAETHLTLYNGMTTEEIDKATINTAVQNIKEDVEFDKVAVRLLLKTVYKHIMGEYPADLAKRSKLHAAAFKKYVKQGVKNELLDERCSSKFDVEALAAALQPERDELFQYAGLSSLLNRYAIKDDAQKSLETPQFFFMRVAMGLSYNEKNPTKAAIEFYNKMSRLEYIAGGSTNIGAGTTRPALSNCFLLEVHDDIDHIAKSVADVIKISKATGGLGVAITKLRASGSPLSSNNTTSTGPTPFAKIFDTAIRAISRGGKKKGAMAFYMENWHLDFPDFIDWKHNAGDDYLRMRTANTAAFISDEFMKRVRKSQDWYLFDPKDAPELNELYGAAFSEKYREYVDLAEAGQLRTFKKVPARELYHDMIVSLMSTGHPWITWKDTINNRALNNNTGTIHMSNLCTEICLPQDRDNIAVCNLASVNIAAHLNGDEMDWERLRETVRLVIRHLDNLIDINELPIAEAAKSDRENRAVGLGVMGFADAVERLGFSYESNEAFTFADELFEFISYQAIDESADLAKERGAYSHFKGSRWSKGMVPMDTIEVVEKDRKLAIDLPKRSFFKKPELNWDQLRLKVKKGIRNATVMAVAPNANIGLVAATTPGIDPRFAQVFSRNKISGKYLDINHNLVKDLKDLGLWEKTKEVIIMNHGDIQDIPLIPERLKRIYKTSFSTSPYAFIEVVARAQKWVDQALSRNMYLETRDVEEVMNIYMTAWEKGVKTTYYLHMKPRHSAEQSTTKVNKSEAMGRRGFGDLFGGAEPSPVGAAPTAAATMAASPSITAPVAIPEQPSGTSRQEEELIQACPIDPIERAQCDSCQ